MNKVSVSDRFEEIAKKVKSKESAFDFNNIVPMPESLNITSGSSVDVGLALIDRNSEEAKRMIAYGWTDKKKRKVNTYEKLVAYLEERDTKEELEKNKKEAQTALDNIKKYGHKDWYSWSIANWGTKWNAYEVIADYGNTFEFQTAWGTPVEVIKALSKMFKSVVFFVQYADEDIGSNCGEYEVKNGEIIFEEEGDRKFANELWGFEDENEDLQD